MFELYRTDSAMGDYNNVFVSKFETKEDAYDEMFKLATKDFGRKPCYIRTTFLDKDRKRRTYDYGSHTKFFMIIEV